MIFHYQALDKNGESVSASIDATSESLARQKIRKEGLYLVNLKKLSIEENEQVGEKKSFLEPLRDKVVDFSNRRSATKYIGLFSRQLSTLLYAGVPLLTAITDIIEQIDNKYFKNVVADVRDKIEEGSSLSNALIRHRDLFSDMYINMVRVGENLGSLDQVIERLADLEEKHNILMNKVKAALYYPIFMLVFAVCIVIFLMVKVIPSIAEIFIEQDHELPFVTDIVISLSNFLADFWFLIPVVVVASLYFYRKYSRTPNGREKIDELKMRIPVFKNLYKKIMVLRFTQNMGILANNKVEILKSFEIVEKIVDNVIIEQKIKSAAKMIKEGSTVSLALKKSDFLPKLVLGMISAGEASDKLDAMLINIGRVYENEIDMTINSLTSLIEPIIIVIMGFLVGFIVLSVMLPIMNMSMLLQ